MKVLSLFSGIGAFEKALDNLGINYELVNYCEIDKYASKSYCAIHNVSEDKNLWDVTKVDTSKLPRDIDLLTYGFPCQDISLAGKQKGFTDENGNQTRSGLFFDALKIIEDTQPKIAIAENVKNLTSKKFVKEFNIVLTSLEQAGYNNYWKVMNAKEYANIPQNRERVFIVSIRKDLDKGYFQFPEPIELQYRLKDFLEDTVDEKFYLSQRVIDGIQNSKFSQKQSQIVTDDVCGTLLSIDYKDPKCVKVPVANKGVSQTIDTQCTLATIELKRGYSTEVTEEQEDTTEIDVIGNHSKSDYQATQIIGKNGVAPTVRENHGQVSAIVDESYYLTPDHIDRISKWKSYQNPLDKVYRQNSVMDTITTRVAESDGGGVSASAKLVCADLEETTNIRKELQSCEEPLAYDEQNKYVRNDGCVGTLTTDGSSPKHNNRVIEPEVIGGLGEKTSNGGRQWYQQDRIYNGEKVGVSVATPFNPYYTDKQLRIRKLTPKECFRLMGFDDTDFAKAESINSNSQLYKQAGNSIVVQVLERLMNNIFNQDGSLKIETVDIGKKILDEIFGV